MLQQHESTGGTCRRNLCAYLVRQTARAIDVFAFECFARFSEVGVFVTWAGDLLLFEQKGAFLGITEFSRTGRRRIVNTTSRAGTELTGSGRGACQGRFECAEETGR